VIHSKKYGLEVVTHLLDVIEVALRHALRLALCQAYSAFGVIGAALSKKISVF
jgi:hypothetical protein